MNLKKSSNIINPLVVVPARGGSKGVPGKNIRPLNAKPLIQYTIDRAREIFEDYQICISTDSEEIKRVVEESGLKVPFLRPDYLATDTSGTYEVLLHALEFYKSNGYAPDAIVLLQATSPFRSTSHISQAMSLYNKNLDMVVSVKETSSNPYYVLFEENESGWLEKSKQASFDRRQDCPKVWEYNGSIYVINPDSLKRESHLKFKKVKKYVMDEFSSLDIDTPLDWKIAECLIGDYLVNK
ncbi:cytidylyltransferase domain-containing protein [Flagellimonas sp.]|uniref:acylneuraminate cytidylyltransferase family protein n=1 Tax=Flagellimonas sp. TaxID=2058762 RepID=UPI003BA87DC5